VSFLIFEMAVKYDTYPYNNEIIISTRND